MKTSQQHRAARTGRAAEMYAAAWLLRNHDVWVAFMPDAASSDMIVTRAFDDRKFVIQVKAAYPLAKGGHRTVNLTRTNGTRYAERSLDWVLAVDLTSRMIWLLPSHLTSKFKRLRLTEKYSGYAFDWNDKAPVFGELYTPAD